MVLNGGSSGPLTTLIDQLFSPPMDCATIRISMLVAVSQTSLVGVRAALLRQLLANTFSATVCPPWHLKHRQLVQSCGTRLLKYIQSVGLVSVSASLSSDEQR